MHKPETSTLRARSRPPRRWRTPSRRRAPRCSLAEDAAQEAYLRAFRRFRDLDEPAAFPGWLRRIVITVALNMRRSRRLTLLRLDDVPDVPVLDEAETAGPSAAAAARGRAADAHQSGTPAVRPPVSRTLEHARLAARPAWTKRRCGSACSAFATSCARRSKWQNSAEFDRRRSGPTCRPRSSSCWRGRSSPICRRTRSARCSRCFGSVYADFTESDLPEIVDFAEARKTIGTDALYMDPLELHRVDEQRILRYDLTLPLLLTIRYEGRPLRIWAAGKAYRRCQIDATHLDAFHQAEVLCLDERARLDPWRVTGQVLQSMDRLLPGRAVKIVPTKYPMCSQAWELEVETTVSGPRCSPGASSRTGSSRIWAAIPTSTRRRRRLRPRAAGDAALRDRRHSQDRRRPRRVAHGPITHRSAPPLVDALGHALRRVAPQPQHHDYRHDGKAGEDNPGGE